MPAPDPHDHDLPELTSDCASCAGLCCVGLSFQKGAHFAIDKAAGTPCPSLQRDHTCARHDSLDADGFSGCVAFDCAGAGQRVTQMRFNGETWQEAPELLFAMIKDFENLRPLHERMTQLKEAETLDLPPALEQQRRALLRRHARLWADTPRLSQAFETFLVDLAQSTAP